MSKSVFMMNTPDCCAACVLSDDCVQICNAIGKFIMDIDEEHEKPNWCPLLNADEISITKTPPLNPQSQSKPEYKKYTQVKCDYYNQEEKKYYVDA